MKLFYSPLSPFARKCLIIANQLNLLDRIELISTTAHPIQRNQTIVVNNPLGQIPTLILDDGQVVHDSRVIAEFLNHLGQGHFFPIESALRWLALTQQSLADGILDSAILTHCERAIRPETYRWSEWVDGQMDKIATGLALFEREVAEFGARMDIGTVSCACALGYIELRFPDYAWRATYPNLAAWFKLFNQLPALQATLPQLPKA